MKIHFLLLALVAVVALSQHNVDARLHDPVACWREVMCCVRRNDAGKCVEREMRCQSRIAKNIACTDPLSPPEWRWRKVWMPMKIGLKSKHDEMEALEDDESDYVEDGLDLFERRLRGTACTCHKSVSWQPKCSDKVCSKYGAFGLPTGCPTRPKTRSECKQACNCNPRIFNKGQCRENCDVAGKVVGFDESDYVEDGLDLEDDDEDYVEDGLDLFERRLVIGPQSSGQCCNTVRNMPYCKCPNGHRYSPSCSSTRRCK